VNARFRSVQHMGSVSPILWPTRRRILKSGDGRALAGMFGRGDVSYILWTGLGGIISSLAAQRRDALKKRRTLFCMMGRPLILTSAARRSPGLLGPLVGSMKEPGRQKSVRCVKIVRFKAGTRA
jgi:hypothetical protein